MNKLKVCISKKGDKLACKQIRLLSGTRFLKKVARSTFLCVVQLWHQKSKQGTHKNCAPEFLILSVLKLHPCGLVVFIDTNTDTDTYTYTRQEFQKIIERKLCNYFSIALDRCSIFTKKTLNTELNMMLIVLMEFTYNRHC